MTLTGVLIAIAVLLTVYSLAHFGRDLGHQEWKVAWLIGENRQLTTRLRQIAALLGLPEPAEPVQPPPPPGMWARAAALTRRAVRRLRGRSKPPVEPPAPEPLTQPYARVLIEKWSEPDEPDAADVALARFTYAPGHQRTHAGDQEDESHAAVPVTPDGEGDD